MEKGEGSKRERKEKEILMVKQTQPYRKFSASRKGYKASALPGDKKRKQKLFPFFNVGISHLCTEIILTVLPDNASLVWPFGVQGLGSADLCICLFLVHKPRRCLYNWFLRCCKGNISMSSLQRV